MKRAPKSRLLLALPTALLLLCAAPLAGGCPQADHAEILSWIAATREAAGLVPLREDTALQRAAGGYAVQLAERGVLSHRDSSGGNALDRARSAGATATLVGEILGSGPTPSAVGAAWATSPSHRAVVDNPLWTHVGIGCEALGSRQVWVVMFAARRIEALRIEASGGPASGGRASGYLVSGRVAAGRGLQPVLLSGLRLLEPEVWSPATGEFLYRLPSENGELYHRLGYRDAEGGVTITDAFFPARAATSSPGTEPR
jgi:uncharacterized protein YkwD